MATSIIQNAMNTRHGLIDLNEELQKNGIRNAYILAAELRFQNNTSDDYAARCKTKVISLFHAKTYKMALSRDENDTVQATFHLLEGVPDPSSIAFYSTSPYAPQYVRQLLNLPRSLFNNFIITEQGKGNPEPELLLNLSRCC